MSLVIKKNNNLLQKKAIERLNNFSLRFPHVKIYDPQALLFKGNAYQWYNKLYKENKSGIKKQILSHNIDLIYSIPYTNTFDFRYWISQKVGWLDIGNHIYYRSWQKELTENFKKLKGQKLIKLLKEDGFLNKKEALKKTYWYVFLNHKKIPLPKDKAFNDKKTCLSETKKGYLLPYCPYTEKEFSEGVFKSTPEGAKEIAVMYLPPLKDFPEKIFLNTLLRYDIFF